jgi:hypothetical protein
METYILFFIFILINSYFSFKAGEKSGRFIGMLHIVQFFQTKGVLKDKKEIVGFKNWPRAIQVLYLDPREELFED